jgi:putative transcriptional regulator
VCVHVVEVPDVRAIWLKLHISRQRFAQTYRIPVPTLKNWEHGRRSSGAPPPPTTLPFGRLGNAMLDLLKQHVSEIASFIAGLAGGCC